MGEKEIKSLISTDIGLFGKGKCAN
jgi:hypothetical protein